MHVVIYMMVKQKQDVLPISVRTKKSVRFKSAGGTFSSTIPLILTVIKKYEIWG